jgi:hypothetical protein
MYIQTVKESIHQMIDQIEDKAVLMHYRQLLEKEVNKLTNIDFFNANEAEMVERAKAGVQSVEAGNTRSIEAFKKDVEAWKQQKGM